MGLLTKQIKNYAKTPSRLGQLGHSVIKVSRSVTHSAVQDSVEELTSNSTGSKSVINPEDQLIISKQEWELIQKQFEDLGKQLLQL